MKAIEKGIKVYPMGVTQGTVSSHEFIKWHSYKFEESVSHGLQVPISSERKAFVSY
jgi:hypothetical protein